MHPSIHASIHLSIYLSIYLSICRTSLCLRRASWENKGVSRRCLWKEHPSGDEGTWENRLSEPQIWGWRAVSAAWIQGKGMHILFVSQTSVVQGLIANLGGWCLLENVSRKMAPAKCWKPVNFPLFTGFQTGLGQTCCFYFKSARSTI